MAIKILEMICGLILLGLFGELVARLPVEMEDDETI
jgi:hypothetical protein